MHPESSPDPPARHSRPDQLALDEELAAGYGRALELEAERAALTRTIDERLDSGDEDEVLALVRRQRHLTREITALRARLKDVRAADRLRRAGAEPLPDP